MKKTISTLILIFFSVLVLQAQRKDSVAIYILDQMTQVMGDLNSFSVNIETAYDIPAGKLGLVKKTNSHEVTVKGNKMLNLWSEGDKGRKGFWYNNNVLHYYSADKGYYGHIEAPATIIEMIDLANEKYGFDFPGVDFWYSSFLEDLMEEFSNIHYLGLTNVDGIECFHIIASDGILSAQIWIEKSIYFLPKKLVLNYLKQEHSPQYEALYLNWELNKTFPDAIFNFTPPPNSKKILIKEKTEYYEK